MSESRPARILLWLIVLVVVAAAGFWAGRTVLVPPDDPLDESAEPVTYTVQEGEVGRSLRFATAAEWDLVPLARNGAAGTVTTVDFASGQLANPGDTLYTVDLRPVLVAEGAIPAFRDMALNITGPDVAQIQELLVLLGYFSGDVDGVYRTSTRNAVQAWQRDLGITPVDGLIRRGDVIFVASLPATLALADELRVGVQLSGGEELVMGVPDDPEFWIPLALEQRDLVPLSSTVYVTYPEGTWVARIDRAVEGEFSQLNLVLTAPDGGSVCGNVCADWVDLLQRTHFDSRIVVIPQTVGPVVPVAAIITDAGNQPYVVTDAGIRIDITILESAQGIAVVEGVELGTVLVLPMTAPPSEP